MRRFDLACALLGLFVVCGCSSPTATPARRTSSKTVAPGPLSSAAPDPATSAAALPAVSPVVSPVATKTVPNPAFALQTSAAASFAMQCVGPTRPQNKGAPPRACILRGKIRAVIPLETLPTPTWLYDGFTPPVANRTMDLEVAPDDGVACSTPLDNAAKDLRLPEAGHPDVVRAGRVRILGGERIESMLAVGKRVCGWARFIARPGQGYPTGWEGELMGADGGGWKLLAAHSLYLSPSTNPYLWRAWSFSREGDARRIPIEQGGAFVAHDAVRIRHGDLSVVSKDAAEVSIKASDGTFAVQALSDLTEGSVPEFVGQHDGFFFAAVRADP